MDRYKKSEILFDIYNIVFSNLKNRNIDLFLCGGASSKKKSYRDQIRAAIEESKDFSDITIFYPEDMFTELLNKKKYDLLTLEKFLANNSDLILIVCESAGSYTELGAFVNNSDTLEKVVALLHNKYKKSKSFIRLGPVEYVKSRNKSNVIYYNNDISETLSQIKKCINSKFGYSYRRKSLEFKDLDSISGQYNFILLLLYFYDSMEIKDLVEKINQICLFKQFSINDLKIVYNSAIRRLFKEGMIAKEIDAQQTGKYKLTNKGYFYAELLLYYVELKNRIHIVDGLRLKILHNRLNI